jgi:hypothetical protein
MIKLEMLTSTKITEHVIKCFLTISFFILNEHQVRMTAKVCYINQIIKYLCKTAFPGQRIVTEKQRFKQVKTGF